MLYYNLTVKSMFLGYRPQDKWIIPPDNSQLQVDSTIEQVNRLRAFT